MYLPLNTSLYGPPQPPPNIEDDNISGFDSESVSISCFFRNEILK